jgi:hypothetical protein
VTSTVSLGAITKQLAKEAIGDQVQNFLGGGAPAAATTPAGTAKTAASDDSIAEGLALVLMGQVQGMQNALKEDQELFVQCVAGGEVIRVMEVFAPSSKVLVLTGLDKEKSLTRIISPADSVQLVCKPVAVAAGAKATRIRLVTPNPKPKA